MKIYERRSVIPSSESRGKRYRKIHQMMAIFVGLILFFGKVSTASAAISFGSASSGANAAAGATTLILTAPASISTGDFLVANIVVSGGGTITITPPTGWTLRLRTNNGNFIGLASYYKIATASEPGSYTWTLTSTRAAGGITRYTGVDTTNPFDTSLGGTGNNATVTAPSITTSQANDMVLVLLGDLSTDTFATVAGATERFDVANTSNPAAALDDYIQIVAGSTGAKTSLTAGNNRFAAQQIALRPLLPPTMPTTPTSTSNITASSIQYNWTSGGGSGTYFQVERSTDGVSYSVIATTTVATTNYTFTGLSPNTQYWFRVASGNTLGLSSYVTSSPTYTLANVAGTPTVSNPTTSSLQLAIATNSNPSNTTYAIYNATLNTYVASNGSSNGATPVYFASSSWSGTVTGLSINTSYQFSVVARNSSGVDSATSSLSTALYTLANPALAPTVASPSTTTLALTINTNSNPSNTTYAIYNNTLNTYVAASGASNGVTPVFFTNASWTGTVSGLSVNTSYQFSVIARNGDSVNAATSSLSTALYTLADTPPVPTFFGVTTSTGQVTINAGSNPSNTEYSILVNNNFYVTAAGTSTSTQVFFTAAAWNGTVFGLTPNNNFYGSVQARNGNSVLTSSSALTDSNYYTLANTPGIPVVTNPATSTLDITWSTNSNTAGTQYVLYNSTGGNYINADGSSNGGTITWFDTFTWNGKAKGLTPNTSYQFVVLARNSNAVYSATSSASTAVVTLASPAGTPTVSNPTTSTIDIAISTNGNSAATTYAIYNTTLGNYLAADGTSNGASPAYFTTAAWNGKAKNLSLNTSYQFSVVARNSDGISAATSSASTALFTLANTPNAPTVGSPTTSTLSLAINVNSNPSNTTYAIYNATSNNYVAANGSSNGATPVFFTNASWTGTVTGLTSNTSYQFSVIARNGDSVNAATSSLSAATSTSAVTANVPGTPTLSNPTTSSIQIIINTNGNDSSVTYALYNVTAGNYLTAAGASSASPVYFTSSTWNNGSATGLSINTSYQFLAIAKSTDNIVTATSSASIALYTLANPALAPTVGSPTTSTLALTINVNSNPANTTYAIYNNTSNNYVASNGSSNGGTPVFFTNASWNGTATGLTSNTSYQFSVVARNGDSVNAATSSLSTATSTSAVTANTPGTPTVSNPTTSTLDLVIATNGNDSSVTYAIYNSTNSTYVKADGTSNGASPVYFTNSTWNGTVKNLSLNTSYQFSVTAKSTDNVVTASSSLSTAVYTLANPAFAPTVSNPTTSTLDLVINTNSNPSNTTYAIYNAISNNYVAANGSSNGGTPVFFTNASWNGTVTGLTSNTSYQFSVIGRNGDNVNTATSSLSTATSTLSVTANTPGIPTVSNPTTSTLDLVIATNGNDSSVTYAIYNTISNNYVKADGASNGATPVYYTNAGWNGTVKNLSLNTAYQFSVTAKSIDNVVTASSSVSAAVYTLATTPGVPIVSNPTTSTLDVALSTNSNPSNTIYAIYNLTSNSYVAANGSSNGGTPVYFTAASWTGTVTGLTSNTSYQFSAIAKNGDGIVTATSTASTATSTLSVSANTPGTPTLSNPTTSTIQLAIATNGNDSSVTYAIYNNTSGDYIKADGSSNGATPVYFTNASWNGTVTGLSLNTSYQFSTLAKSTDNVVTPTSSLSTALYTLANPALAPTVSNPTTTTLDLAINTNSNPSNTTYAIYNATSNNYVASNGSSNGSTPVYFTSAAWSGTVSGLTSNTSYQLSTIARNGDSVNAATSSLSTATSTLSDSVNTPGAPTVLNPTTSTLDLVISTNGNDSSVTYALFNDTLGNYIKADGTSNGATIIYFTSSTWNGAVKNLSLNTSYQFSLIAKNSNNIISPTSSLSTAIFTLANPALAPTVSSATASSLTLAINTNSNPSNTTYAIYNNTSNNYVAANGSSNGATPVFFTSSSWSGSVTGLASNTSYQFSMVARNGDAITAATSSLSTATSTLPAGSSTPGAPVVSNPTTSTLDLAIATGGNPASTTYALYNSTTGNYLAANGSSNGATPVFFATSSWNGTVTGLSVDTAYQFTAIAKSFDNVISATSTASAALYTLANPATTVTASNPSQTTLDVDWSENGNATTTIYALYNATLNNYVASNGLGNESAPVYFTYLDWAGTVSGLLSNTSYQFGVVAQNGDGINATTSSLSAATSTLPYSATSPVVSNPTTSTLDLVFNTGSNPTSTTYALYNVTNNEYVAADGTSNFGTPVFFATSSWNGTVFDLDLNTSYQFQAVSQDNVTSTASAPLFTLAQTPGAPTASNATTSTIDLAITTNGNPGNTTYALYNVTSGNYLQSDGTSNANVPQYFTNFAWNGTVKNLTPNTTYQFVALAKNGNGVITATSSMSVALATGNVSTTVGVPVVSNPTISTLDLAINTSGQATSTTYAIRNVTTNQYLAANGSVFGPTPTYFSASTWSGSVTGLSANTSYQFEVRTSNSDVSPISAAVYTLASVPTGLTLSNVTANSTQLTWSGNGSQYYLENVTANSNSGWILSASSVASSLNCNTLYTFRVKARNGSAVETAFSSTVATTTSACSVSSGGGAAISVSPVFISTPVRNSASSSTNSSVVSTSTPVISNTPSSPITTTASSTVKEALLVPLVLSSSISFSDLPEPGKIIRGDDLYLTYRYVAAGLSQRYKIVREIINEQGGVVRRSVGYQYLRPGQNITSRVQEKETKNLSAGLYTYALTVYDRGNSMIDTNGFKFRMVDSLSDDEEQLLVPLSPLSSIVFTKMPPSRILKVGNYLTYTYSFTFTNTTNATERIMIRRQVVDERGKIVVIRGGGYRILKPGESFSYSPRELLPRGTKQGKYTVYVRAYNQKSQLIDENSYYFRVE